MELTITIEDYTEVLMPMCEFCEERETDYVVNVAPGGKVAYYCPNCFSLEWWVVSLEGQLEAAKNGKA